MTMQHHVQIVTWEIQALHATQANESTHLGMFFNHVENGLGNLVNCFKDWHETMCNM
jgi:hypothetical protein